MVFKAPFFLAIALGVILPGAWAESLPVPVVDAAAPVSVQSASTRAPQRQPITNVRANAANPADLLYQLELLQQEVQSLRGIVEEQEYQIKQMREEQKDRYLDLDRRISALNAGASHSGAVNGKSTPGIESPLPAHTRQPSGIGEKAAYQAAFDLIRNKRYDDAIAAFSTFVQDYPRGDYTGNAFYWLGEVQLVKANYQNALTAFGSLLDRYPNHRKVPDAKYKLGKVYRELGDKDKARRILQEVVNQHSGTSAAKLAEADLKNI